METNHSVSNVMTMFEEKKIVKICAPMVRYSKLQFRTLVRDYGCDLCFTPMILADSFCQSPKARDNEFSTNKIDKPLIVQFAANTVHDFVGGAHMVSPYSDGVDLNCGCPQRWAKCQGLGCVMLENPDVIHDLVRQCRNHINKTLTVSVKMRLLSELKNSVAICQQLERCGVSFLSVHGRIPTQQSGAVNLDALRILNDSVSCPVIANGGVKTYDDVLQIYEKTNCKGVMIANGLLTNPQLFSGCNVSLDCVQKWVDICYNSTIDTNEYLNYTQTDIISIAERPKNITFQCFHHHLVFMLEKILPKYLRRIFNNLTTFESVLKFLYDRFNIEPKLFPKEQFMDNSVIPLEYVNRNNKYLELVELNTQDIRNNGDNTYNPDKTDGNYFNSFCEGDSESEDVSCLFNNFT